MLNSDRNMANYGEILKEKHAYILWGHAIFKSIIL